MKKKLNRISDRKHRCIYCVHKQLVHADQQLTSQFRLLSRPCGTFFFLVRKGTTMGCVSSDASDAKEREEHQRRQDEIAFVALSGDRASSPKVKRTKTVKVKVRRADSRKSSVASASSLSQSRSIDHGPAESNDEPRPAESAPANPLDPEEWVDDIAHRHGVSHQLDAAPVPGTAEGDSTAASRTASSRSSTVASPTTTQRRSHEPALSGASLADPWDS